MNYLDLSVLLCSLAVCLRLVFYHRNGSTFKFCISLLAYVFIVLTGSLALALITGLITSQQLPALVIPALYILTVLVFYTRGNVAQLFRIIIFE